VDALLLVGLSVREVEARGELERVAEAVPRAEVAFLQLGDPSLSSVLDRLADAGVGAVVAVPVCLGPLAPGPSWLRRVAAHWWRERLGHRPEVRVAGQVLGRLDGDVLGVLDHLRRDARPVTGVEAGLVSAAWEEATAHRHQLLLCRGPRCTARRSDATAEAVAIALVEAGCSDDDVLVTHTGCLLPCNHAPVVVVHPDDAWYGGVTPDVGRRLVAALLGDGAAALAARRLPRPPGRVP